MIIDCPPVVYGSSNPYAVAFSPDGATLAVGSGGWYGGGGLSVCRECARVEYATADASELDRAKIARQLGWRPNREKAGGERSES